jgi:hypothetical protein
VRRWHPVTKVLIAVALPAVPYLLISSRETSSVAAVASVERTVAPSVSDDLGTLPVETPRPVLPALSVFSAFVERPLFTPLRRPVQVQQEAAAAPVEAPVAKGVAEPEFRFVGTVIRRSRILGLLAPKNGGDLIGVGVGDTVDGWTVASLSGIDLVVQQAAEERHLRIFR